MMTKLVNEVEELVECEYGRAGAQHGLIHHSDHEAYAILLEELEEAKDEVRFCESALTRFWDQIKRNVKSEDSKLNSLNLVYNNAILGACELIQVAAMAKKAAITVCDRNAVKEFKGELKYGDDLCRH